MTQTEPSKRISLPGAKNLILYWIVFGLFGLFGPFIGYNIVTLDYFVQWRRYTTAPPNISNLLVGDYGEFLVRTTTGQILSCRDYTENCWKPVTNRSYRPRVCDFNSPAFSPLTHPPPGIVDCVFISGSYGEWLYKSFYALDQQGNIWKWINGGTSTAAVVFLFTPLYGVIGLTVGSVIWSVHRILKKQSLAQIQPQGAAPQKLIWIWVMAILPLLCLISFAVLYLILVNIP